MVYAGDGGGEGGVYPYGKLYTPVVMVSGGVGGDIISV